MTTWITDANGNSASVELWGSEEKAREALASNVGCRDCQNCRNCRYCCDCQDCWGCANCRNCRDCQNCWSCKNCSDIKDAVNPIVVGPFRSDGLQFVMGASRSIHAGNHVMVSLAEAREHWEDNSETLLILDYLENAARFNQ
jgi:hypothetical protein